MTNEERKAMDASTATLEALYHQYLIELGESDGQDDIVLAEGNAPQGLTYEDYLRALGLEGETTPPSVVNLSEGGSGDELRAFVDALGEEAVAKRARQYAEQLQRDREEIDAANEKHREEMMMRGGWEERMRRIRLGWHKRR